MIRPRVLTLFPVIALALGVIQTPVFAQIGVAAGLNFENLSDIEAFDAKATFGNASGYHVGVFYDLSLGPVGLRIGALYRDLGAFDANGNVTDELQKVELTMIDFPVDVRVSLTSTPAVQPYVFAGPVFSLPSSTNDDFDGALESLYISGNAGLGISLDLGGIRLFPEFRYVIGVTNLVSDDAEFGGVALQTNDTRVSTAMLRIGVMF